MHINVPAAATAANAAGASHVAAYLVAATEKKQGEAGARGRMAGRWERQPQPKQRTPLAPVPVLVSMRVVMSGMVQRYVCKASCVAVDVGGVEARDDATKRAARNGLARKTKNTAPDKTKTTKNRPIIAFVPTAIISFLFFLSLILVSYPHNLSFSPSLPSLRL